MNKSHPFKARNAGKIPVPKPPKVQVGNQIFEIPSPILESIGLHQGYRGAWRPLAIRKAFLAGAAWMAEVLKNRR